MFETSGGPCVYEKGWRLFQRVWTFFFSASSGFGADFSQISLLTTYRPDLLHLPTANGEHRTGDDDFNGYGFYFPVRLYWTEAGFQAPVPMKRVALVSRSLDPLFFASSGFGADFSQNSLSTFCPDLLDLPTTNGEHYTGDATNMGEAIGTFTIDLEWVQVHPTGLVMTGLTRRCLLD